MQHHGWTPVSRVANRAKRELVARVPIVHALAERTYDSRLRRYRRHLPSVPEAATQLLSEVRRVGVATRPIDALGISGTEVVCAHLEEMALRLGDEVPIENPARPTRSEMADHAAIWQWGLSEPLLDLVENYLGLPARYYGADVRRELVDGTQSGVRNWHRDIEDHRVLKILVWLNEVTPSGGPFAYIDRERTRGATALMRYVSGYETDGAIERVVPRADWRWCPGPQWTAVIADTASVFHRAEPPQSADRYSVTFTWTSRHPVATIPMALDTPAHAAQLAAGLNARQRACLTPGMLSILS